MRVPGHAARIASSVPALDRGIQAHLLESVAGRGARDRLHGNWRDGRQLEFPTDDN